MTVIRHSNLHGVSKHAMMTVAILKLVESYAVQKSIYTKDSKSLRERDGGLLTIYAPTWQE